ncbi:MAG TPA: XdhC family protein [Pseudomonadales bacterium]|nr:XdhC family protein [Pseudomonadales bacterium]
MQSHNEQVIIALDNWLKAGHFCWLITIASTWGSSPRPAGSLMVWSHQQGAVGSLSGGCVEDELLEKLRQDAFDVRQTHQLSYGISAEEATRMRLPCGGTLKLVLEPMPPSPENRQHSAEMVALLQKRQGFTRRTPLQAGDTRSAALIPASPHECHADSQTLQNYLGPRFRLLLIGANQVSEFLAQYARSLDFDVLVCDPRPGAFDHWTLDFTSNFTAMPDDVVRELAHDKLSAVVTLAHDPRVDDMALMEALTTDAFYVGALGSARTTEKRLDRLLQLDLTPEQIARLHAPVGLAIGSKTPAEIALSVAADLVRHIRAKTAIA